MNFGVALLRLGQWKEGLAELRDAARRDPESTLIKTALQDALRTGPGLNSAARARAVKPR